MLLFIKQYPLKFMSGNHDDQQNLEQNYCLI